MTDRYPNGDFLSEKLSQELLERRLAGCALGDAPVGRFVRTDMDDIYVSMPPCETGGYILPPSEIIARIGIEDRQVRDAGYMRLTSIESVAAQKDDAYTHLEQEAHVRNMSLSSVKGVLTIYGREFIHVIDRQSALSKNTAEKISREYTAGIAEAELDGSFLVISYFGEA